MSSTNLLKELNLDTIWKDMIRNQEKLLDSIEENSGKDLSPEREKLANYKKPENEQFFNETLLDNILRQIPIQDLDLFIKFTNTSNALKNISVVTATEVLDSLDVCKDNLN